MVEWLIAGLGNPGGQYDNTRHNAGFWVLDELAKRAGIKIKKLKFYGTYALTDNLLLLKPQTFMNRSGRSVREAAAFYHIPPEKIIVVYDEAALPPGRLRLRASGSDGGHNGMKDILYHLQTDQFTRVRIGVGGPPHPEIDLADWVLSPMTENDRKLLAGVTRRAADAVACICKEGLETAMNRFNANNAAEDEPK
ncbi:MAG: aminoacyl-tRNA hydrolase [Oscillospiraceae bacterium]|nr:aminoacyl-tRNA hydrolase [Oscillospiraceae bacterium]